MAETCSNPLCENPVETHPKAIHPRRFCSNECKLDGWAFKRVAEMLLPLGQAAAWEILEGLDKAEDRNEHKTKQTKMSNVRGDPHTKTDLPASMAD